MTVVATEIDRFAHLGHRVGPGLARLANAQAEQVDAIGFEQIRRPQQGGRALGSRCPVPGFGIGGRLRQRMLDLYRIGLNHAAHLIGPVGRIEHRPGLARNYGGTCQQRARLPGFFGQRRQFAGQSGNGRLIRKIDPRRIDPPCPVKIARQWNFRVAATALASDACQRVFDQLVYRHRLIDEAIDEGAVRAVLQQPAHQIRQQGFVGADRRVDAAWLAEIFRADDIVVERLAHAVQTLEFVIVDTAFLRHLEYRGQRLGIVRGELRIDRIRRSEQAAGADQIGKVGVRLAREYRVVGQPIDLGALDLTVPVGALDQAHHDPPLAAPGQIDQPVDDEGTAFLVGLDDKAHALPAGQIGIAGQRGEQVERKLQPFGLLGVDIEADVVLAGEQHQSLQTGQQFGQHPLALAAYVARMQRRQLDRNPRPGLDAAAVGSLADGMDGVFVRAAISLGIGRSQRRFAKHVEGVAIAARLVLPAARQRRRDALAHDELLAKQAHGEIDALADQWLATPGQNLRQRLAERTVALRGDQLAGHHQPPGGSVDEQRRTAAEVRFPVAVADFVANQAVDRSTVRNAQQRFGQAHQRDALLAGQREFMHQVVDATRPAALAPHRFDQQSGLCRHRRQVAANPLKFRYQCRHTGGLVAPTGLADCVAQIHCRLLTPLIVQ